MSQRGDRRVARLCYEQPFSEIARSAPIAFKSASEACPIEIPFSNRRSVAGVLGREDVSPDEVAVAVDMIC